MIDQTKLIADLQHELTKYDARLYKRDGNTYRLGHYLSALKRYEVSLKDCKAKSDSDYFSLLTHVFIPIETADGLKFDLPPVQKVAKKYFAHLSKLKG